MLRVHLIGCALFLCSLSSKYSFFTPPWTTMYSSMCVAIESSKHGHATMSPLSLTRASHHRVIIFSASLIASSDTTASPKGSRGGPFTFIAVYVNEYCLPPGAVVNMMTIRAGCRPSGYVPFSDKTYALTRFIDPHTLVDTRHHTGAAAIARLLCCPVHARHI